MARGVIVDTHHTQEWIVPRRVMCAFFWVGIILLFTGIILLVTSKHKGSTYQSWGAILLGLGFCLLLICLILCMHAYCVITVADEEYGPQPIKHVHPPSPMMANGGNHVVSAPILSPMIVPPPNPFEIIKEEPRCFKDESRCFNEQSPVKSSEIEGEKVNYASMEAPGLAGMSLDFVPSDRKPRGLPSYSARVKELPVIMEDTDILSNGSPPQISSNFSPYRHNPMVTAHVQPIAPKAIRPRAPTITRIGPPRRPQPNFRYPKEREISTSPPLELPKRPHGPEKSVALIQMGRTEARASLDEDDTHSEVADGVEGQCGDDPPSGSDISMPTVVMLSPEYESKVSIYDNVHYIHL